MVVSARWANREDAQLDGYGIFWCDGKSHRAHRWIFERCVRKLKPYEQVLHKFDNTCCVNLDCLYVGTHADNMRDLRERGNAKGIPKSEEWKRKARAVPQEVRRRAALLAWRRRHAKRT